MPTVMGVIPALVATVENLVFGSVWFIIIIGSARSEWWTWIVSELDCQYLNGAWLNDKDSN